jgi:hypothetical protein
MMLAEIKQVVLPRRDQNGTESYADAVVRENITGKPTSETREKTLRYLRELYGLSMRTPLFVAYHRMMLHDPASAPLLSLLVAWTRDPLLRTTTPSVLPLAPGTKFDRSDMERTLRDTFNDRYSEGSIARVARNASSTWSQSGHLAGANGKTRSLVHPRPAALALALLLGHVAGLRGEMLFASVWCRLLDLSPGAAEALARQAHREGLVTLRAIGRVIEIDLPMFAGLLGERR